MSEIKKLLIDETWQTKYKRQPKLSIHFQKWIHHQYYRFNRY